MERYLKDNSLARKRPNQNRTVAFLLSEMHPALAQVPPKVLTNVVDDCLTLNRYHRKVMTLHPEWHDELYNTKEAVEQQYELEHGLAEMGYSTKLDI